MARSRVALVAKQSTGLFLSEADHLRALSDCFGQLELAGIDSLEVFMPPRSRGGTPICGRPERAKMDVIDSGLRQGISQRSL